MSGMNAGLRAYLDAKKTNQKPQPTTNQVSSVPQHSFLPGPKSAPKGKRHSKVSVKTTGKFMGKSNKLGHGGRAAQLKAKGVPGGVIGNLARAAGAAPGGPNYFGKKR